MQIVATAENSQRIQRQCKGKNKANKHPEMQKCSGIVFSALLSILCALKMCSPRVSHLGAIALWCSIIVFTGLGRAKKRNKRKRRKRVFAWKLVPFFFVYLFASSQKNDNNKNTNKTTGKMMPAKVGRQKAHLKIYPCMHGHDFAIAWQCCHQSANSIYGIAYS